MHDFAESKLFGRHWPRLACWSCESRLQTAVGVGMVLSESCFEKNNSQLVDHPSSSSVYVSQLSHAVVKCVVPKRAATNRLL